MFPYKLVVFDWDGTVMDSTPGIVLAIQKAAQDLSLPVPTVDQARWVIGLSIEKALQHAVPDLSPSLVPKFVERYRYHFLTMGSEMQMFAGMLDVFQWLQDQGAFLAVATGKSRVGLERDFDRSGLRKWFADSRCASESFSKPHPDMLLELMQGLAIEPQETLMVGDTTHDIEMAHNAKVAALAVRYGAHTEAELHAANPLGVVASVPELLQWLQSLQESIV